INRVLRFAFELAHRRKKHLTSATKSNGIIHTMPFWDECFREMATDYPDIRTDQYHIDILTAHFVRHPDWFDVVVGSNLFGDILSDLGPAVVGSIGIAPSANLNPEKEYPSMFEPVHGSAPDIAGKGIANPVAQIWTGAMMLEHLGHADAARAVVAAIERLVEDGKTRTRDLGGRASTREGGQAVAWLSARGVRSGSALAAAHIGVEVLLDAALSGDAPAQQAYRAALEAAAPDELGRYVGWASDEERMRFDGLRARLLARGAVTGDIAPETVAERLRSALADRPRLALVAAAVLAAQCWPRC